MIIFDLIAVPCVVPLHYLSSGSAGQATALADNDRICVVGDYIGAATPAKFALGDALTPVGISRLRAANLYGKACGRNIGFIEAVRPSIFLNRIPENTPSQGYSVLGIGREYPFSAVALKPSAAGREIVCALFTSNDFIIDQNYQYYSDEVRAEYAPL